MPKSPFTTENRGTRGKLPAGRGGGHSVPLAIGAGAAAQNALTCCDEHVPAVFCWTASLAVEYHRGQLRRSVTAPRYRTRSWCQKAIPPRGRKPRALHGIWTGRATLGRVRFGRCGSAASVSPRSPLSTEAGRGSAWGSSAWDGC